MTTKKIGIALGGLLVSTLAVQLHKYITRKRKEKAIRQKEIKLKEAKEMERQQALKIKALIRTPYVDKEPHDIISQEQCCKRKDIIHEVQYTLGVALMEKQFYEGYTIVNFQLTEKSTNAFLDFHGECIYSIKFNNEKLDPSTIYKKSKIILPLEKQIVGQNKIEVFYKCSYSRTGDGLIYYYDENDRNSYVYSQFSPFSAHRSFPCFDQPSIKGTFHLFLICPNGWNAISCALDELTQYANDESSLLLINKHGLPSYLLDCYDKEPLFYMFKKSNCIAPHVFSIIGGPYYSFGYQKDGVPPIRIFARYTLGKYIEKYSQQIFNILTIGTKWFQEFFSEQYMFGKLDVIFCPDFLYKAMENVGALTFCEKYFVFYNKSTMEESSRLVFMLLDKLANMWIGNAATFLWWNSRWINESLTRFLAVSVIETSNELKNIYLGWSLQALNNQRFAYKIDNSPCTHPVETYCRDTSEIIEDSITFDKCTQIISQFAYIIGFDNYKEGLRKFLKSSKFKSSSRNELTSIFQNVCNSSENLKSFDVKQWIDMWVKTSGVNILTPIWKQENGKITEFIIHQDSSAGTNTLRQHKITVQLYYCSDKGLQDVEVTDIWVKNDFDTKIDCLIGKDAPSAVLINSREDTYALVNMDKESYYWMLKNISLIASHLKLTIILYDMYRMATTCYDPIEFFNFLCEKSCEVKAQESSIPEIINYIKNLCCHVFPNSMYQEMSKKAIDFLFKLFEMQTMNLKDKYHVCTCALNAMINLASTKEDILRIDELMKKYNKEGKKEFEIPIKSRHMHYIKLCSLPDHTVEGKPVYDYLSGYVQEYEESSDASRILKACEAALPNLEKKKQILKMYMDNNNDMPYEMLEESMRSFRQRSQEAIMKCIDEIIFENLHDIAKVERRKALLFLKFVFPRNENKSEVWHLSNLSRYVTDKIVSNQIKTLTFKIERDDQAKEKCAKIIKK